MSDANRHLVVLSADAMVDADLEYAFTLPNFKKLMKKGALVRHVRSIYPSVTYPAHTTMASGCWPEKTGICANEPFAPGKIHPDWHWFHEPVKCPDLFDEAKRAGLRTAAVFWPVTGNHPSIEYLIDEYWPQFDGDTIEAAFRRSGSSDTVVTEIVRPLIEGLEIRKHPQTDAFVCRAAAEMLRRYSPNLLMLHPANIDGCRHARGLFGEHVNQAIRETDEWLGRLFDAAEEAGIYANTDFVVMSDHGQMEITRVMCLNNKLREAGLIRVNGAGEVVGWDAYVQSVGMSAHVYAKTEEAKASVFELLQSLLAEETYGFSRILTAQEARCQYHLAGDFAFVLETDGYTSFGDDWRRPLVRPFDKTDYRHGRATHGYMPEKGPQAIFMASGPHVNPGAERDNGLLIEAAPTMAAFLGISLPESQGKAWEELVLQ